MRISPNTRQQLTATINKELPVEGECPQQSLTMSGKQLISVSLSLATAHLSFE